MSKINGVALAAIGTGTLFTWSGIKGWSVLGTAGDIVAGKRPSGGSVYGLSSGNGGEFTGIGSVHGLAAIAELSVGHAYIYGGAPGKDFSRPWDCSSAVDSWATQLGLAIPGYGPGKYDGSVHGPPTGSWILWTGIKRVPQSEIQRDDIIIWATHMGVAVSGTHMMSALNPSLGTQRTRIAGPGPIMKVGRYA